MKRESNCWGLSVNGVFKHQKTKWSSRSDMIIGDGELMESFQLNRYFF